MREEDRRPARATEPPEQAIRRAHDGARYGLRPPTKKYLEREDEPGRMICPACHAISIGKRWFFDEHLYEALRERPDVKQKLCPGDQRLASGKYEGEIMLRSASLADPEARAEAISLIRNETSAAAHEDNPLHRVKVFDEGAEELHLVTTTGYLAERIGKAFRDRWHADDTHPQGSIRVRLLKSAVRRNAASRNQREWPRP